MVDGLGRPIDGLGPLPLGPDPRPIKATPPPAADRARVGKRVETGVRVLDLFAPLCEGQRLGLFAGSGVGKSVLLSMLARWTECDVAVIGLVGERGREVQEFVEDDLRGGRPGAQRRRCRDLRRSRVDAAAGGVDDARDCRAFSRSGA